MDKAGLVVKMDPVTFAQRVKEARTKKNLTQEQVAQACGITDGTVSAWEKGKASEMMASTLMCVSKLLGVSPEWLVSGESEDLDASADVYAIASELTELSPDQREAVRSLIRSMKR